MGIASGHYQVQQLKGKLAELPLTSPSTQGMCLAVVPVAAAGAVVAAAAVVAEENKQTVQSHLYYVYMQQSPCRQLHLLYIELSNSFLIARKSTANFRNQRP